jgi:hypothetical protein
MEKPTKPAGVDYSTLVTGANADVIIDDQASPSNTIIVKGCTTPSQVGPKRIATVKFNGITTPAAAKETNLFTVEMYKTYSTTT